MRISIHFYGGNNAEGFTDNQDSDMSNIWSQKEAEIQSIFFRVKRKQRSSSKCSYIQIPGVAVIVDGR